MFDLVFSIKATSIYPSGIRDEMQIKGNTNERFNAHVSQALVFVNLFGFWQNEQVESFVHKLIV